MQTNLFHNLKRLKIFQKRGLKQKFINYLEKDYNLESFKPIGNFQKKNLMMAIKACEILGLSKKNISKCINSLNSVKAD